MNASSPRVSVVLPARDCGGHLDAAVRSILAQTVSDLELLVIDDGTRDGSLAQLPNDPRIDLIANRGRGIVDALNTGIAHARGRYIARMDGDDIALPERLERQIDLLESHRHIGIAGGRVEIFTDQGPPGPGYARYQRWVNSLTEPAAIAREAFVESPIPHPTAVFRRELLEALGGYRHTAWAEDYDLWLRAAERGVAMAKPDAVVLRWRDDPARLSRRDPRCSDAGFIRARAHYLARSPLGARPVILWGAGRYGARLHDALDAEGVATRAFIDIDARKIGGSKRGRPVLDAAALSGHSDAVVVGAVRREGAHDDIRAALTALGRREGRDFVLAG